MTVILDLKTLYEIDDSLWLEETIELLKAKNFEALDLENLIEELEDLGNEKKFRVASFLQQIILFQNRRGYSPLWECESCSWVPMCTRCDVSLTYHKFSHQLRCHYCGYTTSPVPACHACGSVEMKMLG